jgi:hypothetical protein
MVKTLIDLVLEPPKITTEIHLSSAVPTTHASFPGRRGLVLRMSCCHPLTSYWGFCDLSVNAWSCSTVHAFFLIVFSWGVLALCWCFEFAIASGLNSQKKVGVAYSTQLRIFLLEPFKPNSFEHLNTPSDFLHCACAYRRALWCLPLNPSTTSSSLVLQLGVQWTILLVVLRVCTLEQYMLQALYCLPRIVRTWSTLLVYVL